MKHKLFALCALAALSTQAAVVNFQISPAGSDSAVGLSSTNEVPAVTSSTGSGGTFSAGILLDTDTAKLTLAVAYGSAGGFTDLTGPATGWRIHGPAPAGQNAPAVIDLAPYVFLSATPEKGGLIVGEIAFPAATVPDLLAGRYYLNIETEKNTSGEIRGQLIATGATNLPPSVSCPGPITVECPAPAQVTVLVSDPEGDALTAVWSVNGAPLQTNTLAAPSAPANLSFVWSLPLGTNVIAIVVTDSAGNSASCSSIVTVVDTVPPVITSVVADHTSLWPPNHQMVPIKLDAAITDACGPVTWKIVSVTSNEPVNERATATPLPIGALPAIIRSSCALNARARAMAGSTASPCRPPTPRAIFPLCRRSPSRFPRARATPGGIAPMATTGATITAVPMAMVKTRAKATAGTAKPLPLECEFRVGNESSPPFSLDLEVGVGALILQKAIAEPMIQSLGNSARARRKLPKCKYAGIGNRWMRCGRPPSRAILRRKRTWASLTRPARECPRIRLRR